MAPRALAALLALLLALSAAPHGAPWPRTPKWSATWQMSRSTIFMPCNASGMFDPAVAGRYGIADFDWSN
jgi:hypothetical protein